MKGTKLNQSRYIPVHPVLPVVWMLPLPKKLDIELQDSSIPRPLQDLNSLGCSAAFSIGTWLQLTWTNQFRMLHWLSLQFCLETILAREPRSQKHETSQSTRSLNVVPWCSSGQVDDVLLASESAAPGCDCSWVAAPCSDMVMMCFEVHIPHLGFILILAV